MSDAEKVRRGDLAARFRLPDSEPYLFELLDRLETQHKRSILHLSSSGITDFVRHRIMLDCLAEIRGQISADAEIGKRTASRMK